MELQHFGNGPEEKTPHKLKNELESLLEAEATLWELAAGHLSKAAIPEVMESMVQTIQELRDHMQNLEVVENDFLHSITYTQTPLAKELEENLKNLESHVQEQITLLDQVMNMSEEEVKRVLDLGKESNLSKTSVSIRELIRKVEDEIEKMDVEEESQVEVQQVDVQESQVEENIQQY